MSKNLFFLDLFAGAGGLSEGFIQAGFKPVAHIEMDIAACYTLKTRMAYHWLNYQNKLKIYSDYISNKLNRSDFYQQIPEDIIGSVINAEISVKTLDELFLKTNSILGERKLDLIIGGPPCQAYSVIGRSRDQSRMVGDKRNYLYELYAEFLDKYKPKYFVFENVTGLLSAKDKNGNLYFDSMLDLFHTIGYETEYSVIPASHYGILQNRKRIILVGRRGRKAGFYPEPDKWNPDVTVNEIFADLPFLKSGEGSLHSCKLSEYSGNWLYNTGIRNNALPVTFHQARPINEQDAEIYKITVELWNRDKKRLNYNSLPERLKTHQHRNSFTDRFKVVASDLPFTHTLVAHIAKDGHYYIHPDINQNRSITPREAARIQTFPDDYYFESVNEKPSRTPAFRQIGNAVPVLLAKKIACKLKEAWL